MKQEQRPTSKREGTLPESASEGKAEAAVGSLREELVIGIRGERTSDTF